MRRHGGHRRAPMTAATGDALTALADFVAGHRKLFVLTGAGVSTASGIPAYRDADGQWQHATPVMLNDFLGSSALRARYWRRSMAGWPVMARAHPNDAHVALADLEARGLVRTLVTQNVDGLHARAGSRSPIELHGNVHRVRCLDCRAEFARSRIQRMLESANGHLAGDPALPRPDGDAAVASDDDVAIVVPACPRCGGTLKPDVVFFGEGVPAERVAAARAALESSDAMLVVGSSLAVYSGYRFCQWAAERRMPIAAINLGRTRADPLLALKLDARCGPLLAALVERLRDAAPPTPEARVRPRRSAG
jgi:NAD-dependent SIR2 family protein deacetylase